MSYSQNQLIALAKNNPKELARVITSPNANSHMLASGAELLGEATFANEQIVLPALRQLLKHVHALVREGAITGLASFYLEKKPPQDILDKLMFMSEEDPSPIIKECARSLLKDFHERKES